MEIRNVRALKWFGINGIVLWPLILYADKEPHPCILNHEAIHLAQIRRNGIARFYLVYVGEYAIGRLKGMQHDEAYRNISFELEAYANQNDLFYLAKSD